MISNNTDDMPFVTFLVKYLWYKKLQYFNNAFKRIFNFCPQRYTQMCVI